VARASNAEELLRSGDPAAALAALQSDVRAQAADPKLRVFLFQLLCVMGQWERALNQLKICADLDAAAIPMREMYGLALLIESSLHAGVIAGAAKLRDQAFEQAPETSGDADGKKFSWIADGDTRLGPVLEAIVNGRYYWIPFSRLRQVAMEKPTDLRDYIWSPANLQFANGGEVLAMIPVRYSGSESSGDGLVALGRKTIWEEGEHGSYRGLGQRLFNTDAGEISLLDIRKLQLDGSDDATGGG
jgi:type VI secretion system protein ImpE